MAQVAISILDETTTDYYSKAIDYSLASVSLGESTTAGTDGVLQTQLNIAWPHGYLRGTMDDLILEAKSPASELKIGMRMEALGPILPILVTGIIPFGGGVNYEYALPRMKTSGTIVLDNRNYEVSGTSWFDREWGRFGPCKWTWMAIHLKNDVQIALWDEQTEDNPESFAGKKKAFATLLCPDGSIVVAPTVVDERSFSDSPARYPTKWSVRIATKQIELSVSLLTDRQEIKSEILPNGDEIESQIPRIEGRGRVEGNYEGKHVEGGAFVELFNLFPFFSSAYRPWLPKT